MPIPEYLQFEGGKRWSPYYLDKNGQPQTESVPSFSCGQALANPSAPDGAVYGEEEWMHAFMLFLTNIWTQTFVVDKDQFDPGQSTLTGGAQTFVQVVATGGLA